MSKEHDAGAKSEVGAFDFLMPLFTQCDKIYSDMAKRHGESYMGMWVLEEIGEHPEGVTQKHLCEALYSPKQTVNSLVSAHVRRGLVETKPNSRDGRSKLHVLTEEGKAKFDAIRSDEEALEAYSLEGVSEEELALVRRILTDVTNRFAEGVAKLDAGESLAEGEAQA